MAARPTLNAEHGAFTISWNDAGTTSSDVFAYGSWAYTAP
jgi:hypothetical protein